MGLSVWPRVSMTARCGCLRARRPRPAVSVALRMRGRRLGHSNRSVNGSNGNGKSYNYQRSSSQMEKNGQKASEAKEVKLYGQIPPVERMDESLSTLVNCEKLSLSTNCIERIANLNSLKNLRILSLGRNNIKNLNGLEAVADTLEELWISYNFIEKLRGIRVMKKLKVLYMSNNLVKDWAEFVRLAELPLLEDLVFVGNPLQEKYASDQKNNWIEEATKRVPTLKKLDDFFPLFFPLRYPSY
ncbi:dynein axonemal light chain 1 isoform X2 [Strix aluco]|uniref:dynein axonemal light chain 1 isoform X2 n=1 Tax=Strix aluco TaxID=111821 RepID=UPI003DA221E8